MIRIVAVFLLVIKSDLIFCDKTNDSNNNGSILSSQRTTIGSQSDKGTQQILPQNGMGRYRRNSKDLNFLRLYLCESGYQNCMPDESKEVPIQPDILNQISQMFKLPGNFMNWGGRELNLRNLNLSGQREQPVFADEPSYLLVQTDQTLPQPLALLSGPPTDDDPFIPQRGRRTLKFIHSNKGKAGAPGTSSLAEKLAKNARQQEQLNGILHQHPRTLASNGYFLPVGHARANDIDGTE